MVVSDTAWHVGNPSTGWRVGAPQDWGGTARRYIPAGSVEYLRVPVMGLGDDTTPPRVRLAIVPRATVPDLRDWQPVTYDGQWARLLLTGRLTQGEYVVWVEINHGPERVLREAGLLTIRPGPAAPAPTGGAYLPATFGTYLGSPATGLTPAGEGFLPETLGPYLGESA